MHSSSAPQAHGQRHNQSNTADPSEAVADMSSAFTLLFYPHGELGEIPTKMSCRLCSKCRIGSIVATSMTPASAASVSDKCHAIAASSE